jgi:hypothetical protein
MVTVFVRPVAIAGECGLGSTIGGMPSLPSGDALPTVSPHRLSDLVHDRSNLIYVLTVVCAPCVEYYSSTLALTRWHVIMDSAEASFSYSLSVIE